MSVVEQPRRAAARKNSPVELKEFLEGLREAGRIDQAALDTALSNRRRAEDRNKHVLLYVADLELDDKKSPGRKLDIESLTQELGQQCGQNYYRIDPLKIDVAAVTQVMDHKFSQRHEILAVENNPDEVVITSAEPYLDSWESV